MKCGRERWSESAVEDERLDGVPGVRLRSLSDIEVSRKVIVDNVYFVGLGVMRCYCGRFRYTFDDREPFTLEAGELAVIYPEHYVTIEALEAKNRLMYCFLDGADTVPFFDGLGFFDCARGRTSPRIGGFLELRSLVEDPANKTPAGHAAALRYLTDMVISQLRDLKMNGNAFLYEAARLIHANLKKGLVRLDPLCAQLKVSRAHLHKAFVEAARRRSSDANSCASPCGFCGTGGSPSPRSWTARDSSRSPTSPPSSARRRAARPATSAVDNRFQETYGLLSERRRPSACQNIERTQLNR